MERMEFKSKWTLNSPGCHINNDMTGKMIDVPCISTSRRPNPFCIMMAKNKECVCSECYVESSFGRSPSLVNAMKENYHILTERKLDDDELPIFKDLAAFVRIEAFGELANYTQAENYMRIIYANPNMPFGWWSKRINIIDDVIDVYGKPENLSVLQSSAKINEPAVVTSKNVDHRFTVYSEDYVRENGILINCGAKGCRYDCGGLCYHRNGIFDINEMLRPRKGGKK